jgi:hypothetical protein
VGEVVVVYNGVSLYGREMKNCFARRIVGVEKIVTCVASRSHLLLRLPLFLSVFFSRGATLEMPWQPELNKRGIFNQYKRDVTTNAVPQFCRDQKFRIAKDSLVNEY